MRLKFICKMDSDRANMPNFFLPRCSNTWELAPAFGA
jgi:hypothetical protein